MKIDNINIHEFVKLKNYNTYRINGEARYLIEVNNTKELITVLKTLKDKNIPYFLIGAGSNIIIDDYFEGAIIKLSGLDKVSIKDNLLTIEAGAMMSKAALSAINASLEGLEWAINIPGTIGGSIVGNAGAYNSEIFDNLMSIKVLNENLELEEIDARDIMHAYRDSELKYSGKIVVEATFKLNEGNKEEMLAKVEDRRIRRLASQPLEYPSAGSVFRNPENDYAGRLIESVGLKGKKIGGAEVSEKHANFIINVNNATSKDIKDLIKLVHDTVLDKCGVDLVLEQEMIDWSRDYDQTKESEEAY